MKEECAMIDCCRILLPRLPKNPKRRQRMIKRESAEIEIVLAHLDRLLAELRTQICKVKEINCELTS